MRQEIEKEGYTFVCEDTTAEKPEWKVRAKSGGDYSFNAKTFSIDSILIQLKAIDERYVRQQGWAGKSIQHIHRDVCDFPLEGELEFKVIKQSPNNEHSPWCVVLPGGACIEFNHHANDEVDQRRAVLVASLLTDFFSRETYLGTNT